MSCECPWITANALDRRKVHGSVTSKLPDVAYRRAVVPDDRSWLLNHLDTQARYVASLVRRAREHPEDREALSRVRDEIFTLRETIDTLEIPGALASNDDWRRMPQAPHADHWPTAADLAD